MRHSILFFVLATVALAAACEPSASPTDPGEDQSLQAATAPEGQINELKDALFPEPEIEDVNKSFSDMKKSLSQDDTEAARSAMFEIVELGLTLFAEDELLDPEGDLTTTEALIDLIQALYQFVGFDAPSDATLQTLLDDQTDGQDGVVGVLGPEGGTLVTPDEFAGVEFPEDAVDGDILVIIERKDVQDASDCLPTPLPQAEGCYRYDTSPPIEEVNDQDSFNVDVTVGICRETVPNPDDYLLHKFDPENPGEGVIQLPTATAGFLDCASFSASRSASPWWGRLAQASWRSLDRHVFSWVTPTPLRAADQGLGGTVGAFSTIGWAEAATLTISSGDAQDGDTGSLLTDLLQVELSRDHGGPGVIEGVEVEFEVLGVDGDLASSIGSQVFTTTAKDTTNSDGIADIAWRLGSTVGTQTVVARVPGADPDSVIFTAGAADLFQRHDDLASFQSAIGNAATQTQDFESFSTGTSISVIIQGVLEVTSPFDQLEVSSCAGDNALFGSDDAGNPTRTAGNGRYELDFVTSGHEALAFEVRSQDPATDPAEVEVQTGSGNASFLVSNDGPTESDPTFFGLTSTVTFDNVIVHEGPEIGGSGNEEICLDDFIVEATIN